jgi:hypothetical protein
MSINYKTCFKTTNDDWYPNYPDNLVRVSLILRRKKSSEYKLFGQTLFRVCVWGDDDFGMEKDFKSGNEQLDIDQAKELYQLLVNQKVINKDYLKQLGFYGA